MSSALRRMRDDVCNGETVVYVWLWGNRDVIGDGEGEGDGDESSGTSEISGIVGVEGRRIRVVLPE